MWGATRGDHRGQHVQDPAYLTSTFTIHHAESITTLMPINVLYADGTNRSITRGGDWVILEPGLRHAGRADWVFSRLWWQGEGGVGRTAAACWAPGLGGMDPYSVDPSYSLVHGGPPQTGP